MSTGTAGDLAVRCPRCGRHLEGEQCTGCGERFSVTRGILDLRWPRPSRRDADEDALVAAITARYDRSTFGDLSDLVRRHRFRDFSEELQDGLRSRSASLDELGERMVEMFDARLSRYYRRPGASLALDLGCGYGTSSIALARRFDWVVGVDPDLSALLLAKKCFEDRDIHNVTLVQAYAQRVPLAAGCVDYAVALNVIEHLLSVRPAFLEVRRVLRPGGCFCGDSRNRYDLFCPEPHVKVRWVGLFPRRLQAWYVRAVRGVSYANAHACLLSWWELRRCARRAFGHSARVVLPLVSAYRRPTYLDRWVEGLEATPVLGWLARLVFPSHLLLAQAPECPTRLQGGSGSDDSDPR